jgi:Ca2+-binding EF-hand superfamily protein
MKIGAQGFNLQDIAAKRDELFKKLDQDGDGKIGKDELKTAMSNRAGGANRPEGGPSLDDIFSRIDTNGDDAIDKDEHDAFLSSIESQRPPAPPDPSKLAKHLFEKGDTDADGKLTKAELTSVLPKHDSSEALDALFAEADEDGDGSITQAELQASLEKRLEPPTSYSESGALNGSTSGKSRLIGIA